jgi:Zn-dependent protease
LLLPAILNLPGFPPALAMGVDPAVLVVIVGASILSLSFHEWAHAFAARRLGDDTAERAGRLTLNPLPHIDPIMTVLFPAMIFILSNGQGFFGGARPVPVNPTRFRNPNRDNAIVAAAGPLSNLFLATIFLIALRAVEVSGQWEGQLLPPLLNVIAEFNVLLFLFNLIPIPPLDGSRIVRWLLPESLQRFYVEIERYGMFLIFGLVFFFRPFQYALWSSVDSVADWIYNAVRLGGVW